MIAIFRITKSQKPDTGDFFQTLAKELAGTLNRTALAETLVMVSFRTGSIPGRHFPSSVFLHPVALPAVNDVSLYLQQVRDSYRAAGKPEPVFSIDHEGGTVQRLALPNIFASPLSVSLTGKRSSELAHLQAFHICRQLRHSGIYWNLAPVADLTRNIQNPVVRTRGFGADAEKVSELAASFVTGTTEAGCIPALKHYPGHGQVGADSHLALPEASHADPVHEKVFAEVLQRHPDIPVMTGHLLFRDTDSRPVPLSSLWLSKARSLTNAAIITDDIGMKALSATAVAGENAVAALTAGADLVLFHAVGLGQESDAIIQAIIDSDLTDSQLREKAMRIVKLKLQAGMMNPELRKLAKENPVYQNAVESFIQQQRSREKTAQLQELQLPSPESIIRYIEDHSIRAVGTAEPVDLEGKTVSALSQQEARVLASAGIKMEKNAPVRSMISLSVAEQINSLRELNDGVPQIVWTSLQFLPALEWKRAAGAEDILIFSLADTGINGRRGALLRKLVSGEAVSAAPNWLQN